MTVAIKTVFLGSPALAIPSLQALVANPLLEVVGVVSQPDLPAGRRRQLRPSPVKEAGLEMGLAVFTPHRIGDGEALARLRGWGVQLAVVCAYGQIFPEAVLSLPTLGCYNLHFSLLPRWRGASPLQAAILAGDALTGVTLQRMVRELDAGDIAATSPPRLIGERDTAESLGRALALDAAALLSETLPLLITGQPPLRPQPPEAATFCRIIGKSDGAADFSTETALQIARKCRAYNPWPGCHAFLGGKRLVLLEAQVVNPADHPAGEIAGAEADETTLPGRIGKGGLVVAREGALRLLRVKPEGKGAMDWRDFQNGNPGAVGQRLLARPG